MKKIFKVLLILPLMLSFPRQVYAVCPVCTIAIGAGLGLSRYLGVDDLITGFWIGAIILSLSFWLTTWVKNKFQLKIKALYLNLVSIFLNSCLVFIPLSYAKILGHPLNQIWGVDKLIFGSIVGSGIFLLAVWLDNKVRQIKGKQLFNYQRVVFPFILLSLASLTSYLVLK